MFIYLGALPKYRKHLWQQFSQFPPQITHPVAHILPMGFYLYCNCVCSACVRLLFPVPVGMPTLVRSLEGCQPDCAHICPSALWVSIELSGVEGWMEVRERSYPYSISSALHLTPTGRKVREEKKKGLPLVHSQTHTHRWAKMQLQCKPYTPSEKVGSVYLLQLTL